MKNIKKHSERTSQQLAEEALVLMVKTGEAKRYEKTVTLIGGCRKDFVFYKTILK